MRAELAEIIGPNPSLPWPALLRDLDAARFLSVSRRELWKGSATGDYPKPVRLPGRKTRWRLIDLQEYVEALK